MRQIGARQGKTFLHRRAIERFTCVRAARHYNFAGMGLLRRRRLTRLFRRGNGGNGGTGLLRLLLAVVVMALACGSVLVTATVPPAQRAGAAPNATLPASDQAYWMDASNGAVYAFGGAPQYGTMAHTTLSQPVVGMASTGTGGGYWMVASDGGIFTFGNARFHGSMGGSHLNQPIVAMALDPATGGYWEVASDGGIFSFNAPFFGSMGGSHLNQPIVGMAATATGGGYWLVASDGGIFTFGNARFYGSTGSMVLNRPIVGMSSSRTGNGYFLVASDGGIFTFGNAAGHFYGSLGGVDEARPIVGVASLFNDSGYWMANNNGGVTNFGTARYFGSAPQAIPAPVVGIAVAQGTGSATSSSYQSGSYGYDISNYQCTTLPPNPHAIGVVEVNGWGDTATNACLKSEATWAGAGLNLYVFMVYGTSPTAEPGCTTTPLPSACNFGYQVGLSDYATARATIGTRATVPWWLDVEHAGTNWSSSTAGNYSVIEGTLLALNKAEGLNTVGIYASPSEWPTIAGNNRPSVPYFAADWAKTNPQTVCASVKSYSEVPSGPLALVQYSSPSYPYTAGDLSTTFDNDYAC